MVGRLLLLIFITSLAGILPGQSVVFNNINVIPMDGSREILSGMHVLISDGRIADIAEDDMKESEREVERIDGQDLYLMPGLTEMHAHLPRPQEGNDQNVRDLMFLYLANGVTTIRGMLGDPFHLKLREQARNHDFPAPRIYTSSPSMNGNSVQTIEEAVRKVTQYQKDGYDFLKIHPGIQLDVFNALVKTANEVGIGFAGHVPADVGINHAIASGYLTVDHIDGYLEGMVDPEDRKDKDAGFFGSNFIEFVNFDKLDGLAAQTKSAEVAVVPTQSLFTRWISPQPAAEMMVDPEFQYISPALRYAWANSKERMLASEEYDPAEYWEFLEIRKRILKSLHAHGVRFLLGSDSPQVMNVPGFSIYHEIKALLDADIPLWDVLLSGTAWPAQFFDEGGEYGIVTEGAVADLIVLGGNPFDDPAYLQKIVAVMYRGNLLSREEIDARLKEIAQNNAEE